MPLVELPELVQVQHGQRQQAALALGALELAAQRLVEGARVGKAGQRVGARQAGQLALVGLQRELGLFQQQALLGQLMAQFARVLVPPSGYVQGRLGARWLVTPEWTTTIDGAVYVYDVPVRGVPVSMTAVGSVEWLARPWLRAMVSATVMRTPWAAFEVQGLARLVVEFGS